MPRPPWRVSESEAFLLEMLPIALYRADRDAGFSGPRRLGDTLAKSIGFKPVAFAANADLWTSCIHSDDRGRVVAQVESCGVGQGFSVVYRLICADESERVFLDRGTVVDLGRGRIEIRGVCLDITERARTDRRLLWSRRLEAMGAVIEDMAHDLMNMLSVTVWNLDSLTLAFGSMDMEERHRERMAMALTSATSGARLFKELVAYAKRTVSSRKAIDPADLLRRIEPALRLMLGDTVKLAVEFGEVPGQLRTDEAEVEAMLIALALRAGRRLPEEGTLRLRLSSEVESGTAELPAGDYVAFSFDHAEPGGAAPRTFAGSANDSDPSPGDDALCLDLVSDAARLLGGQLRTGVDGAESVRLLLPRIYRSD